MEGLVDDMKFYTYGTDRDGKNIILDECRNVKEAEQRIEQYEFQDKVNDVYEPNSYGIMDENYNKIK